MGFKAPLAQVVERAILANTTLFAVEGETNLLPLGGLALLDKILDDTAFAGTLSPFPLDLIGLATLNGPLEGAVADMVMGTMK